MPSGVAGTSHCEGIATKSAGPRHDYAAGQHLLVNVNAWF